MAEEKQKLAIEFEDEGFDNFLIAIEKLNDQLRSLGSVEPLKVSSAAPKVLKEISKRLSEIKEKADTIKLEYVSDPGDIQALGNISKEVTGITDLNEKLIGTLDGFITKLDDILEKSNEFYATTMMTKEKLEEHTEIIDKFREAEEEITEEMTKQESVSANLYKHSSLIMKEFSKAPIFGKAFEKYAKNMKEAAASADKKAKAEVEAKKNQVNYDAIFKNLQKSVQALGGLKKTVGTFKVIKKIVQDISSAFSAFLPIIALLSIAGFVREMVEADKEAKSLYRDLTRLAATQKDIFKLTEDFDGAEFMHTMHKMEMSIIDFAKRWGTTIDDAKGRTRAMVESGIALGEVLGRSVDNTENLISKLTKGSETYLMSLGDEISTMATFAGKTFEEMAADVGRMRNEFGESLDTVREAFTRVRMDAAETGLMTNKFFERVLNASSGLIIYGNRVADVSALFADLAKSMDLPREKAAELAEQLIKGANDFTMEQKMFMGRYVDVEKKFREQLEEQTKQRSELEAQRVALEKTGTKEDQLRAKAIENQIEALNKEISVNERALKIENERFRIVRMFDRLDPTRRFQTQIESVAKILEQNVGLLPEKLKGIDLLDPKNLAKYGALLEDEGSKLEKVLGETLNLNKVQIETLGRTLQVLGQNFNKVESLSKLLGINSEKLTNAVKENDPKKIGDVLKNSKIIVQQDPGKITEAFKQAGLDDLIKGIDLSTAKSEDVVKAVSEGLSSLNTTTESLGKTLDPDDLAFEMKSEKEISQEIAANTTAIADILSTQSKGVQQRIYEGIRYVGKWTRTIWEGLKNLPGIKGFTQVAEKKGLMEEELIKANDHLLSLNKQQELLKTREKKLEDRIKDLTKKKAESLDPREQKAYDKLIESSNKQLDTIKLNSSKLDEQNKETNDLISSLKKGVEKAEDIQDLGFFTRLFSGKEEKEDFSKQEENIEILKKALEAKKEFGLTQEESIVVADISDTTDELKDIIKSFNIDFKTFSNLPWWKLGSYEHTATRSRMGKYLEEYNKKLSSLQEKGLFLDIKSGDKGKLQSLEEKPFESYDLAKISEIVKAEKDLDISMLADTIKTGFEHSYLSSGDTSNTYNNEVTINVPSSDISLLEKIIRKVMFEQKFK